MSVEIRTSDIVDQLNITFRRTDLVSAKLLCKMRPGFDDLVLRVVEECPELRDIELDENIEQLKEAEGLKTYPQEGQEAIDPDDLPTEMWHPFHELLYRVCNECPFYLLQMDLRLFKIAKQIECRGLNASSDGVSVDCLPPRQERYFLKTAVCHPVK